MSATAIATTTSAAAIAAAAGTAPGTGDANPALCRFFVRGICRFGEMCRFSHDLSWNPTAAAGTTNSSSSAPTAITTTPTTTSTKVGPTTETARPSTSKSWANAPVFIPKFRQQSIGLDSSKDVDPNRSWAEVAGGAGGGGNAGIANQIQGVPIPGGLCPYEYDCPFGLACTYQHIELCEMCDSYCLHPTDTQQRRKHIQECLQQHERDMELSFAIARSKDKQCGICFDTIMEKAGREKRFGILPNCSHIFCLECIRKWRQAKQFEHKITRACPECRVASDFVCPSAFWVETKEEKDKLLVDYRNALGIKDCKYFKKGDGKCPFGNKCFYKHALPNGELVDVGLPQRARKLHRNTDELIDLLDG
ncbi:probable E3 ubiquitin-protein ligase makorin-1 isoform X2 [Episyrphus balteatus]|uniref:probable E3 ubiquitin-protein ligase makorin-1 isoform X2 n=1 Tax=Episyrphus balteatus TaxID=286459 RepID=UPI00248611F0|nr:probable E3 ubiquitin-protein ligase makorin-1 isoform X2 [Episyrphus balteatus]